mgnify:CR=1 FL=1
MQRRSFLSSSLKLVCVGATGSVSGCGTIFHSERNYQPHSRDIDWKVAALNGLGLLLFFVPGVIAFIVDFHTGAIYLPLEEVPYHPHDGQPYPPPSYEPPYGPPPHGEPLSDARPRDAISTTASMPALRCVEVAREDLHPEGIQAAVEQQLGKRIDLQQDSARVAELENLAAFEATRQQCQANPKFGTVARQFFRERFWRRNQSA